ncbi:hypothetical protein ABZT02_45475 [Streptomyces sp. NPDC005402]|uniref:hypothetical protein n=1 Tax=Streptomyces sp. NPDC005402 TaxID=3155338 RepID=UPI00339E76AD
MSADRPWPATKITICLRSPEGKPCCLPPPYGPGPAALSALAALLLSPTTAHAAGPGDTIALPVRDAMAALVVQDEDRTGYERTKFRH